jgi:polysaccharide export outer membrane protein
MTLLSRKFLILVTGIATMAIAGCASTPASSPDKVQQALSSETRDTNTPYILGVSDVVTVSVWRNEDLSISVPVRPDGMISVPVIGDVRAAGNSPETLAGNIEEELSGYIREPQVSIIVTSMGSNEFRDRVRVTGAVAQPISIPYRDGMTVLDILLSAGGASQFAALNDSMLYRPMSGEVVAIPVRLDDILTKGDVETNYRMRPGDILAVPERSF